MTSPIGPQRATPSSPARIAAEVTGTWKLMESDRTERQSRVMEAAIQIERQLQDSQDFDVRVAKIKLIAETFNRVVFGETK